MQLHVICTYCWRLIAVSPCQVSHIDASWCHRASRHSNWPCGYGNWYHVRHWLQGWQTGCGTALCLLRLLCLLSRSSATTRLCRGSLPCRLCHKGWVSWHTDCIASAERMPFSMAKAPFPCCRVCSSMPEPVGTAA